MMMRFFPEISLSLPTRDFHIIFRNFLSKLDDPGREALNTAYQLRERGRRD